MASDVLDSELPDLDDEDNAEQSTHFRLPLKRNDFYSDSSDIDTEPVTEASPLFPAATHHSKSSTSSNVSCISGLAEPIYLNSRCSELPDLAVVTLDKSLEHASSNDVFNSASAKGGIASVPIGKQNRSLESKKGTPGAVKLLEKEEKKMEKEKQKLMKLQLKQQAEFEKSKKRLAQEAMRSMRPGECLKYLTVVIDTHLLNSSCGPAIVKCLQVAEIRYEVNPQPKSHMISFWREVTVTTETEPNKLETKSKEIIEDEILIYVPLNLFIEMIDGFHKVKIGEIPCGTSALNDFILQTKSTLDNRNLTLLVQGIEGYFRLSNLGDKRAFRNRVVEAAGDAPKRKRKAAEHVGALVTRIAVEEAALACQLQFNVSIKFLETDEEVAKTITHYAKAVAEKPYKQELSNRLKSSYSGIFVEGCRGGTRIGADGQGLARVWCQQLQQFKNLSAEVANSIAARYASPRALIEAYQMCKSDKEAESLLEDIVVRRGAGIVSTTRRVGKEMSRRIYNLMASDDGNMAI